MTISVDWATKIITVEKADMTLVQSLPLEIYDLPLNFFRLALKDLEDDEAGMPYLDTHRHNSEVVLGGITYARVIEIINGYTVTFEDGQYAVNLIGANSNVGDVVNVNQVSIRSANSAGLITNSAIEFASYTGAVTVDVTSPNSGTIFPTGTLQAPVNNLSDAYLIAQTRGFRTYNIIGDITIDDTIKDSFNNTVNFQDAEFVGEGKTDSTITISSSALVDSCTYRDAKVTGTLDGDSYIQNCELINLNYVNGFIENSTLDSGTITLGDNTGIAYFINCHSGVSGTSTPIIDMGGADAPDLIVRNYHGGIKIINNTTANNSSIDFGSGQLKVGADVTAGNITVRGIATITEDFSSGTAVIDDQTLNLTNISSDIWKTDLTQYIATSTEAGYMINRIRQYFLNKRIVDPVTGEERIFTDDDLSILMSAEIFEDADGTTPYQGAGIERRDQMS
jgi:hypothetical protein